MNFDDSLSSYLNNFSTVHLIAGCRCEPPLLYFGGEAISPITGIASGENQERPRKDMPFVVFLKITRIFTVEIEE